MKVVTSTHYKYLLVGFTQWLTTKGYVPNTVKVYPEGVKEYFLYLEGQNILNINKVLPQHSAKFKLYLQYRSNRKTQTGGICNMSVNGIIKAINCFSKYVSDSSDTFKYDIQEDYLPVDVAEKIILTQDEVKQLYNATFEPYPSSLGSIEYGQRDRAILAIFYGAGLRLNEGRKLELSDIDFTNRRVLVRYGKKGKQRYVPIPNQHLEDLRTYIQQGRYWFTEKHHQSLTCYKRSYKKSGFDQGALFLNIRGGRLLSFTHRLDYLKEKVGITKPLATHGLRHALGTHLYQNGLDIEQIKKVLGHKSIDTTQIYVHIAEQLNNEANNY
jgi:integrase/recombinase XerD